MDMALIIIIRISRKNQIRFSCMIPVFRSSASLPKDNIATTVSYFPFCTANIKGVSPDSFKLNNKLSETKKEDKFRINNSSESYGMKN